MPITVDIDPGARFVNVRVYGRVTLADILDYFSQLESGGGMPYPKLVDCREAEPELTERDVRVVGARMNQLAAYEPRGPLAVVVGSANEEVVQRMLHLGQGQRAAITCHSVEAARQWLRDLGPPEIPAPPETASR